MITSEVVRQCENNCPFIFANETLYQLSYTPEKRTEYRFGPEVHQARPTLFAPKEFLGESQFLRYYWATPRFNTATQRVGGGSYEKNLLER
jgi:hypothetical protein